MNAKNDDSFDELEPEIFENSPYCECDLEPTIEESDWGICDHCGKPIL